MSLEARRLGAVVLAAGASTRMGSPKALLSWRGRAFVAHAIALAREVSAQPIVVVEGAAPLPDAAIEGARRIVNRRWAEGPLGSLQAGLAAVLEHGVAGVLVLSVDRPHVSPTTITALESAWRSDSARVWQPRYRGEHGHPIVWPSDLALRVTMLEPPDTPRTLVHAPDVASRRGFVDVADAAVIDNLDRPEDLSRLP